MAKGQYEYSRRVYDLSTERVETPQQSAKMETPHEHLSVLRADGPFTIHAGAPNGPALPVVGGRVHLGDVDEIYVTNPVAIRPPRELVLVNTKRWWIDPNEVEDGASDPLFGTRRGIVGTGSAGDIPGFRLTPADASREYYVESLSVTSDVSGVISLHVGREDIVDPATDHAIDGVAHADLDPADSIIQPQFSDAITQPAPTNAGEFDHIQVPAGGDTVQWRPHDRVPVVGESFEITGPDAATLDVSISWRERTVPRSL